MILINKTANPDGSTIKHTKPFNPAGLAIYRNGIYLHEIKNTLKSGESLKSTGVNKPKQRRKAA